MPYFDPKYFKRKSKVNRVVNRKIKTNLLLGNLTKITMTEIEIMAMVV